MFALKIDNRKYIGHTATLPCPVMHGTVSDTNVRIGHLLLTTLIKRIDQDLYKSTETVFVFAICLKLAVTTCPIPYSRSLSTVNNNLIAGWVCRCGVTKAGV